MPRRSDPGPTPPNRAIPVLAGMLFVGSIGLGCAVDEAGERADECPTPPSWDMISPPPGSYADRGLALDYSRLAPLPDPKKSQAGADIQATLRRPARFEQMYHDATHGNLQAAWLVCDFERGARDLGQRAARHLASLKCQTYANCTVKFGELPFSSETASGLRIREVIARAFRSEARILSIRQDLVMNLVGVYLGAKVKTRLRKSGPPAGGERTRAGGNEGPLAGAASGKRGTGKGAGAGKSANSEAMAAWEAKPMIRQLTPNSCGPTCGKMLLAEVGIEASRSQIASRSGVLTSAESLARSLGSIDKKGVWRGTS